jgi:tetratricopeptide (TPR) repeat protein
MAGMARLLSVSLVTACLAIAQPESAEEWRKLGLAKVSEGELKQATTALRKACELEQPPGDSCYYLARNLQALGQYEDAGRAFDLALAASPPALTGRVLRAKALNYSALGKNEDAERTFRKALDLGGTDASDVRIDFGAFLFRQGRETEASKLLEDAVKADPKSARANLESGRVLLQLNRLEAAAQRLETAVRLNPSDHNGHLLLGRAYQRLGRDADAERELQLGANEWKRRQPKLGQ